MMCNKITRIVRKFWLVRISLWIGVSKYGKVFGKSLQTFLQLTRPLCFIKEIRRIRKAIKLTLCKLRRFQVVGLNIRIIVLMRDCSLKCQKRSITFKPLMYYTLSNALLVVALLAEDSQLSWKRLFFSFNFSSW